MNSDRNIEQQIDETLHVLNSMEKVKVSPFFKDKTMNVLFAEKETMQVVAWSWFTPKLQLVTLVCFVVLNAIAFTKLKTTSSYEEYVSEFAESYGLSTNADTSSILN